MRTQMNQSIAKSLTRPELEQTLTMLLDSFTKLDEYGDVSDFVESTRVALRYVEQAAQINEQWRRQASRVDRCAKCRANVVAKQGRVCHGCLQERAA